MFILCVMSIIFMCSQPFISVPIGSADINRCPYKIKNITTNQTDARNLKGNKSSSSLFYILLAVNLIASAFDGTIIGFVDSGVVQKIDVCLHKPDFGKQRSFGAVGFGCGALVSSVLIDSFPTSNVSCYSAIFCVYFVVVSCLTISSQVLFKDLSFKTKGTKPDVNKLIRKTLFKLETIFFMSTTLFVGTANGLYLSFLFLFLKELGAPNLVMGLSITIGAVSSFILFAYSTPIIKLLGGTMQAICLCCFSWSLRFLCFSYLQNPWLVLLIQPLQGPGFGLLLAALVQHVKLICPPIVFYDNLWNKQLVILWTWNNYSKYCRRESCMNSLEHANYSEVQVLYVLYGPCLL